MSNPGQPFTEEELYRGFRLTMPEEEARTMAFHATHPEAAPATEGPDPASPPSIQLMPDTLLCLSLVSEELRQKVAAYRDPDPEGRDRRWLAREMQRAGLPAGGEPPESLVQQRQQVREQEAREWEERREGLRQALVAEGRLPPE